MFDDRKTITEWLREWGWMHTTSITPGKRCLIHRKTGRFLGAFWASDVLAAVICDAAFPDRRLPEVPGFTTAGAALRRALTQPAEESPR